MPITKMEVYSSSVLVDTFPLSDDGIELDKFQITNIDGLDPVKASIGTSSIASVDGVTIVGEEVDGRNIVLTIRPNPDWNTWTFESLRRQLFLYFTPKNLIQMIFYTDEISDVEISGIVESVEANPFSKDPEFIVSVICSDAYFTHVTATVITGNVIGLGDWPPGGTITVQGDVPIGFELTLPTGAPNFGELIIQSGSPTISTFHLVSGPDDFANDNRFEMDSRSKRKFIRGVDLTSGTFENVLKTLQSGSVWPRLYPGENLFAVLGDDLLDDSWELTFYEKFGGL